MTDIQISEHCEAGEHIDCVGCKCDCHQDEDLVEFVPRDNEDQIYQTED